VDTPHGRAEHGMIEPFEPNLVREVDGQKDRLLWHFKLWLRHPLLRVNFKVFTNIYSTIVDPEELRSEFVR
jgi:dCTP deaminase